jgi:hypothetical protein
MEELAVITFVTEGAKPMEADFPLEFRLFLSRHLGNVLLVADLLIFIDFLQNWLKVELQGSLWVRRKEPHSH